MIISRRPNKRQSTERAPGPTKATTAASTTTRTAGNGVSNRFSVGLGNHESAIPTVPSATRALANGVRNPISSKPPPARNHRPMSEASNVPLPPSVRYTLP